MIGFRVDANLEIGTGHLMRCLSIAKKLKEHTNDIIFISADSINRKMIEDNGFFCRILDSNYKDLDSELNMLCNIIGESGIDTIVIDSYFVTKKYLDTLKKHIKIMYVDDLHEMVYPCDMLVNYTIFAEDIDYLKLYGKSKTKLLLGCKFAPLRDEFEVLQEKAIGRKVGNILVLSGGTDHYHFILKLVEAVAISKPYSEISFHIVCGRYNEDKEKLEHIAAQHNNIFVYENLTKLKSFMESADIAISAGGTTLYELAACGTPTIGYSLADNQLENLKSFSDKGCLLSVGDIRQGFPKEELLKRLEELADREKREKLSHRMKQLVDGNGCRRLAEEIMRL